MILVDSSVWINYFNGKISPETNWLDAALGREPIVMGDLILTEVLQGFYKEKDFSTAKKLLLNFPCMEMLGKELAIESALTYRSLRKKGITVSKTIDVIIATFCLHYHIGLLHDHKDFDPMEKYLNLEVVKVY